MNGFTNRMYHVKIKQCAHPLVVCTPKASVYYIASIPLFGRSICDTMATSTGSRRDDRESRPTNNMEVEFNLSWFTKRDKPLISIKTKKDDTSSESSSSGESYHRLYVRTVDMVDVDQKPLGKGSTWEFVYFSPLQKKR